MRIGVAVLNPAHVTGYFPVFALVEGAASIKRLVRPVIPVVVHASIAPISVNTIFVEVERLANIIEAFLGGSAILVNYTVIMLPHIAIVVGCVATFILMNLVLISVINRVSIALIIQGVVAIIVEVVDVACPRISVAILDIAFFGTGLNFVIIAIPESAASCVV